MLPAKSRQYDTHLAFTWLIRVPAQSDKMPTVSANGCSWQVFGTNRTYMKNELAKKIWNCIVNYVPGKHLSMGSGLNVWAWHRWHNDLTVAWAAHHETMKLSCTERAVWKGWNMTQNVPGQIWSVYNILMYYVSILCTFLITNDPLEFDLTHCPASSAPSRSWVRSDANVCHGCWHSTR